MEELPQHILESWKTDKGFKVIYNHYSPYVWRLAYRTVNGNQLLAQEVTQAVFVKVLTAMKGFKFQSAFSSWLYTVTYHETLAHLKKRGKRKDREAPLIEATYITGDDEHAARDSQEEVQNILQSLSPEDRFLLVSKEIDGLSFEELEEITGRKSGALRTALSRLKKQIQGGSHVAR